MSAYPRIPFRLLLDARAEAPGPPSCPDYGFPSVPRADRNRCAEPWIATYDVPCTPEAVDCLLFRRRHYAWRQTRLLALIHRRPALDASAASKVDWCGEVLRLVIDMADDTNVARPFLTGFGIPDHLERTRAHLRALRPTYQGQPVPLMYPELWLTGRGDETIAASQPVLGYYVLAPIAGVDTARSAYLVMPGGRTRSLMAEHVLAAHALEWPRPIPTRWRAIAGVTLPAIDLASVRAAMTQGRAVSARDLSVALFATAPTDYLVGSVERATGSAPCLAGPADRACFHYEHFPVAIAGAQATMDLLEAHARDWIEAPFDRLLNQGFQRYLTYLKPFAESGQLGLEPEELRAHAERAARDAAIAGVSTTTGTVAAAVTPIPVVGPIVGAVVAVLGAVLSMLLEVLPIATGDGTCPQLGFRRMLSDPECAVPRPQGNTNIAALLTAYRTQVAFGPAGGAGEPAEEPAPARSREAQSGGLPVLPLLGGAALLALGLAYLAQRRRQERGARSARDASATNAASPNAAPDNDDDGDRS